MGREESRLGEIAASSLKVGVSTLAGLVGWVVGGKILALELGAAGVGIFGLLRQLLQNLNVFSTFSGTTALVQGVASRSGDEQARYVRATGCFFAWGGLVIAAGLLLGARWLGPWLLPHPQSASLLRWTALAVVAVNAQTYFTGLLSAYRSVNALVRSQLMGPVAVLLLAWPVARLVRGGSAAGLVAMLGVPGAVVGVAAMVQAWRSGLFQPARRAPIRREDARSFFGTSLVMLASGALMTGMQYVQSRLVAEWLGLEQAGQFWVAWTLSMTYVTILLTSYGTYYMPALSALRDDASRHSLIRDYLRLALLVMPVLVSFVVVFKPWVVLGMFSAKLLPAVKVMRWMLIGDFLKGVAWVLAFPMLAFNEMRRFFWTEAAFNVGSAVASWVWLASGGSIEGLGVIFVALYALYLPLMLGYVARCHRFRVQKSDVAAFLAGLALVLGLSRLAWEDVEVRPLSAVACFVLSATFVLFIVWRSGWTLRLRSPYSGPP